MKTINLILIAIIAISQCQAAVTATEFCDNEATELNIVTGQTKTMSTGGQTISTWDDLTMCLIMIDSSVEQVNITIDSDVSSSKDNSIGFSGINSGISMSFTITSNSGLLPGDLEYIFYESLEIMYEHSTNDIVLTIDSDILLKTSEFTVIQKYLGATQITESSTFNIGKADKCAGSDFSTCVAPATADEPATQGCYSSFLFIEEVTLTQTNPYYMKACLEKFNSEKALVTNLTVDLRGATSIAITDSDIDFVTILADIKDNITDLTILLSNTGTTAIPVVFNLENLKIDYSDNGLSNSDSETVIEGLKNAAQIAGNSFEITFSKFADTNVNVLENAEKLLEIGTLSADKIVKVSDGAKDCSITSDDVNGNDCEFVVIQPTVSQNTVEQCPGEVVTISFDSNLDSDLDGSNLDWTLDTDITAWTQLSDTPTLTNLDTSTASQQTYTMSISGPVTKDSNVITVVYKTVDFTVQACNKPTTTFVVDTEDIKQSYPICTQNIPDFVLGISQAITNNQQNVAVDSQTQYSWDIKQKDANGNLSTVTVAGNKDGSTFTITGAEFTKGSTYVISVTVNSPTIIVNDFEFSLGECDAQSDILINGTAQQTTDYNACQDLELTLSENNSVELVQGTTTYNWTVVDSQNVNILENINNDGNSVTIPQNNLNDGNLFIGVTIINPTVTVTDIQINIDTTISCNQQNDDDDDDDDDDRSSLLSLGLLTLLAGALIL